MKISSKFMRTIISKLIAKAIKSKIGCDIDIQIQGLNAIVDNDKVVVKLNADAQLSKEDFRKILNDTVGLD